MAKDNSAVLIRGKSEAGKERFAHAIHQLSIRRDKPFVSVVFPDRCPISLKQVVENAEKNWIAKALEETRGDRMKTAALFRIHDTSLYCKNKYQL